MNVKYLISRFIRRFCIIIGILFIGAPAFIYGQYDFSRASVLKRLSDDMRVLTADSLQGREAGTVYEIKARDYIAGRFKEIGLEPIVGDTSYVQKFTDGWEKKTFYNVCGFLDNKAKQTVVVGAHYDHLGMGDFGSRYNGSRQIHNGADDNASGTISVIEMARYLSAQTQSRYNYMFVAFTGEEKGLYGSAYFVKSNESKKINIAYMINFDMVGRFNYDHKNRLVVLGTGSSPQWKRILKNNEPDKFNIKKLKYGPPFSDHSAFYNKGIPLLYFTTGLPSEYHTPFDDYKTINFEGIIDILEYVKTLNREIDKLDNITFKESNTYQIIKAYFYFLL